MTSLPAMAVFVGGGQGLCFGEMWGLELRHMISLLPWKVILDIAARTSAAMVAGTVEEESPRVDGSKSAEWL